MPTNPNSNSELIVLHAWEDNPIYLKCVQGENGIKIAKFQLVDDNGAINLTGNTGVVFMGTSGDGSAVSVNCIVDSATDGKVSLSASTNFTNAIGNTKGNIVVNFSNNQNIQFDGITVKVRPNRAIDALIHDDTFATFLAALSRLQNIEEGELTTVDSALDTNSTNPVQNSAIADKFNEVDAKFDSYIKAVNANTLDDCTNPNYIYRVYVSSVSVPSWNTSDCYCRVLVMDSTAYLTQYIFSQINWKFAVRYKDKSAGSWSDLKYFALSGDTLAAYGIEDAYTKSEVYNKDEVDGKVSELSTTIGSNKSAIENRMDIVEGTVSGHTNAIGNIQTNITQHNTDINSLKSRTSVLEDSMDNVYDKEHTYSQDEIDDIVDTINETHDRYNTTIQQIWANYGNQLSRLEGTVSGHTSSISNLQSSANQHNTSINSISGRVDVLEDSIDNVYDKDSSYSKDEIDDKVSTINSIHNNFVSNVQQDLSNQQHDISVLESAVSGNTSSIGTLSNVVGGNSNRLIALENSIVNKMSKDFLSVTSFMCDEDGTIFAATDDTVLTSRSFENQDKTSTPYFIWIAKTVTEVEDNAFVNTGKIAKIYCETSSADTPLPSAYRSLPVEYGINNLFSFYILRSLVTLYNDKVNKNDVYTADTADSTFERVANKSDTFDFNNTPTAAERLLFPTVARMKEYVYGTYYDVDEIDNLVTTINQAIATKANSSDVYTQSQIREMITVLETLCDELGDQISERLRNINDVIKTNHITDGNVTEQKLSADVQAKLNKNTGIYSYTIPASGWNNNAQTLDLSSVYTVTNNTKVDTEGDSTVIEQLVIDDCGGIYVENNNGTLTIKAIGNAPTANITVQFVVYEVESLD